MSDLDTPDPEEQGLVWIGDQLAGFKNAVIRPLTEADILESLSRTEVIETEGADLLVSPGQVYLIGNDSDPIVTRWGGEVSMEVELPEHDFWRLINALLGPEAERELRQDVEDILRWEGEGGPCMVH